MPAAPANGGGIVGPSFPAATDRCTTLNLGCADVSLQRKTAWTLVRRHAFHAGGLGQHLDPIRLFPRELGFVAAEVAIGGGLLDRSDAAGRASARCHCGRRSKCSATSVPMLSSGITAGALGVDHDVHRLRNADRVGDLHLALARQACRDDVLRDIACRIRGGAIDLGRILAGERAAAVRAAPP